VGFTGDPHLAEPAADLVFQTIFFADIALRLFQVTLASDLVMACGTYGLNRTALHTFLTGAMTVEKTIGVVIPVGSGGGRNLYSGYH